MLLTSTVTAVVLMNVLALALVSGRAALYGARFYRPMLLNIGLSVLPLAVLGVGVLGLVVLLAVGVPPVVVGVLEVVVAVVWLLLLPNSGYLVTELNLSHRKPGDGVPEWFDVLLVLSLAMSGVLNLLFDVFLVQLIYAALRFNDVHFLTSVELRVVTGAVLLLVTFGVYIGRNVRLNSWDVVRPHRVLGKVAGHLREPGRAAAATGFTLLGGAFFGLMYLAVIGPLVQAVILLER